MSHPNQGNGPPVGRTLNAPFLLAQIAWGAPVVTGAAAVTIATTPAINELVPPPVRGFSTLCIGAARLLQTAGTGLVTLVVERSLDGGTVWTAAFGGAIPTIALDVLGVAGPVDALVPIFAMFEQTGGRQDNRLQVQYRLRASVSAGAGEASCQLQTLVV